MRTDLYRVAGLRRNPFAWQDATDPGPFLDRGVGAPPRALTRTLVQLIGDKGAGKTTTLRHWIAQTGGPYHHVAPSGRGRWRRPPVADVCYWDEIDRMPVSVRREALRRAARQEATVLAGTHVDMSVPAAAAGMRVKTWRFAAIGAPELRRWIDERIELALLDGSKPLSVPDTVVARVASEAGQSWRVAGDLMHSWVAKRVAQVGQH